MIPDIYKMSKIYSLDQYMRKFLDIIFPRKCILCENSHDGDRESICPNCMDKIPFINDPVCDRCGIPFEVTYSIEESLNYLCGECRSSPPLFDRALSVCQYDETVRDIIAAYKYQNKPYIGKDLVSIINKFLGGRIAELFPELIIHVPLHVKRLKERGYDQAYILADGIGRELNIRVSYKNLVRTSYTTPQVDLNGMERMKNVKGAFFVTDPAELKDRSILLIDDVFTTGATIKECVKVIKKAGAGKVYVLTFAKA
jgi:ComF family protein